MTCQEPRATTKGGNYGDQGVSNEARKKQSDSGYIFKVYTIGFPDGLDVGHERKESQR